MGYLSTSSEADKRRKGEAGPGVRRTCRVFISGSSFSLGWKIRPASEDIVTQRAASEQPDSDEEGKC